MNVAAWVLLALLLAALGYFLFGRGGAAEQREVRRLIRVCNGDRELAERLIFSEMQRDTSLGIASAAQRARRRLARDRR